MANSEMTSKSVVKTADPFIGADSFKTAPNEFRLLNLNRPPSVAFTMVSAAVEFSVLATQWACKRLYGVVQALIVSPALYTVNI